ncbi:MAG: ATP-binding cassette domain-containing protein [Nostocaceae cyanobacterium]|nr:ATP-binding cassette domain-containing protein [Nostocaceae cyanobacterium]
METSAKPQLKLEQVSLFASLRGKQLGYPILQDISLEVLKGDRIAIVGASGAGKTYLLHLLNRLLEPTSGKIYLENQEYRHIPVLKLRQQVVLVLQESKLLGMKVKQALAYPLILRGFNKQTIEKRLSYWQQQLQIPNDWLERTEVQLSMGQKQLVAIARALVTEPQILLLDEPTSSLDASTSNRLLEVLAALCTTHQTTILMVNHQLDLAQQFCTRLLHLHQGSLLADKQACVINWAELQASLHQAEAEDEFGF